MSPLVGNPPETESETVERIIYLGRQRAPAGRAPSVGSRNGKAACVSRNLRIGSLVRKLSMCA